MIPTIESLNDFCASAILRAIRKTHTANGLFSSPILDIDREIDGLRFYWALSDSVNNLVQFLIHNSRSPLTRIDFETVETYGYIPGILLASESVIDQIRRADPCVYFVEEPSATLSWPANRLIAWTLSEALQVLLSAQKLFELGEEYEWLHGRAKDLDTVLRIQAIREIRVSHQSHRRPTVDARRACARSKNELYRLALDSFLLLDNLEAGEQESILKILRTSILPALAEWRRLELASVLSVAESLASVLDLSPLLSVPMRGGKIVATVGNLDVYWQFQMPRRDAASLDATEKLATEIMTSLAVSEGRNFADVAVVWRPENKVVAIVECKWFESDDAETNAIRDAASQISRYVRDVYPNDDALASSLAASSIILVSSLWKVSKAIDGSKACYLTDFDGLCTQDLLAWAQSLITSLPVAPIVAAA
jgi:hypothetical protein